MKTRSVSFCRSVNMVVVAVTLVGARFPASAQQTSSPAPDANLAQSIQDLREQIQELRSAVSEIKSEAAQYRTENQELRKELENIRANPAQGNNSQSAAIPQPSVSNPAVEQRVSSLEETSQVQQSELRT